MMRYATTPSSTRRLVGALALVGAVLVGSGQAAASPANVSDPVSLTPTRAATAAETKCGKLEPGIRCEPWDGVDVRTETSLFVVGFENNQEMNQKHVLQAMASFDLGSVKDGATGGKVAKATLSYSEASTTRRSATGDSEYGILSTCNTRLGVPTDAWKGDLSKLIPTTQAMTDGVAGATTGDAGYWDVTPQVAQWVTNGAGEGTFVFRAEDESLEAKAQTMCLSYIIDPVLTVEFAPAE